MTRKFRDSLTSICLKRLVVYKFFPSIRTHIGLALFIMINKQVIVAPLLLSSKITKIDPTGSAIENKLYETVIVKFCPKIAQNGNYND